MNNELHHLIEMINQISDNNLHHGEAEHAADMVATHLKKFWARSMKDQIIAYAENDGSELNAVSRLAVEELKAWRQAKAS